MQTTWKPYTEHGDLTARSNLPDSVYAFPKQKKEPLTDASHAMRSPASTRSRVCPIPIASSPSPISRRRRRITAST
jgi:hypothetical protein